MTQIPRTRAAPSRGGGVQLWCQGPFSGPGVEPRLPGGRVLYMERPPRNGGHWGRHCRFQYGHGISWRTEWPGRPYCRGAAHGLTGRCQTVDHTAGGGHMLIYSPSPPQYPFPLCWGPLFPSRWRNWKILLLVCPADINNSPLHVIFLWCLLYHSHLPQCVCEGVGNCFRVRPGRNNPCIIPVPEGRTQPWVVRGPPTTSLPQYPPLHPQLR